MENNLPPIKDTKNIIHKPATALLNNKACVVCGEEILAYSKKCKHCESFQNYRRHLIFGNSFLTLLIALISVSTLAFTSVSTVMQTQKSELHMKFQGFKNLDFKFLITNEGTKPGGLGPAFLTIESGLEEKEFQVAISCCTVDADFIPAGAAKQISYRLIGLSESHETRNALVNAANGKVTGSYLTVQFINFGSKDQYTVIPISTAELNYLLGIYGNEK